MENTTSTRAEYSTAVMPEIEFISGEISKLIANPAVCSALGSEFTERMKQWEIAVEKRRTEPFSLVVLGDFKRGKSTVINAILGKNVTPANVAPETFTINSISYGETPGAEAVLKNGQRIRLAHEDLVRERLEHLAKAFPDEMDYIDIRDNADILKEIRIVDTPGLSDLDRLDKQVQDYLVNADAIVYIATALSPMSETEQTFLANFVRPLSFGKFFVLVNMIDAMNSMEDIDKILGRITERVGLIIPNAQIFGISGIDEYRRKIGLTRPDIKGFQDYYENEFLKFELSLKQEVIIQKDTLKLGRVVSMLKLMVTDSLARINMIQSMSDMSRIKLEELAQILERECADLFHALEVQKPKLQLEITEMLQEAEQWIYAFFAKFRADIVESRNSSTPDDIDKYFYPFLVDKVGEAYRKCIEAHKIRVEQTNERISHELSRRLGISNINMSAESDRISKEISKEMGSLVTSTVMSAAGQNEQAGFPTGTVSSFRTLLKRRGKTDTIDTVLENYDDIRNNIAKDLKRAYEKMELNALQSLDAIYRTQSEAGRDALAQAKRAMTDENPTQKRHLQNATHILESADIILQKYA
ncbi:MAG: dynamin family protein [Ruminococcus sp.]|jgi:ribosome biogenesis GTPase A|nr:dynamin family protein [Ruminococcus sp.]